MTDTATTEPAARRRSPWAYTTVIIHAAVVLVIAGGLLWADLHPTVDANIGAGFLMLALMGAGLPWSFATHAWLDGTQLLNDVVIIATALVNIVPHWALMRWATEPDDDEDC